ncbi:MAG TPA: S8 family serine peptidase [Frankiaceae bacterium]|jgi:serine protease AprX|nr:S8 family serine peptidase [Frankiaceae bacterium]
MVRLRKHAPTAVAVVLAVAGLAGAKPAAAQHDRNGTRVIVTTYDDRAAARVGEELQGHGARNLRSLPLVHGFSADVPSGYVAQLRRESGVRSVTVDREVRLMGVDPALGYDAQADLGSLYQISRVVHAQAAYEVGITGKGIDVALIDSGVAPVKGLTSGNVVNGPDLSFESQSDTLRHYDTFGHGTHMAGIIAGRDKTQTATDFQGDARNFNGIAPDSRIVSVKVADHSGATDVSQVLAGIDWVVANKSSNGLNIRVLNLSFGTDSVQPSSIDPLCFAVENAWRRGIVVVVSGGNGGASANRLTNPGQDPFVIAVGADDSKGTISSTDDTVPAFSSRSTTGRTVDVVAPGMSVLSLRDPDSAIDQAVPSARVGTRFFRGTGTSQAAAVVSGAAALLLQRYPYLTPDQVKKHLMNTAVSFPGATAAERGSGVISVRRAFNNAPPTQWQSQQSATLGSGTGSLEGSRGSLHVGDSTSLLTGEQDIFGNAFDSAAWARATSTGNAWSGGSWLGNAWSGNAWSEKDWTGNAWSGTQWGGNAWSGNAWSDESWSGHAWSGDGWNGTQWLGSAWSGAGWSGTQWAGTQWAGTQWAGAGWSGAGWSSSFWQ